MRAAFTALVALLAAPAWAGTVTLKPLARTAGPYVRLGEVAEVSGDPLWEEIFLGPAPASGEARRLSREAIKSRLAYLGVPAEVDGAEEAEVRLSEAAVPSPELSTRLKAEIDRRLREQGWALGQAGLELPATWESAELLEVPAVPDGGGELAVRLKGRLPGGVSEEKKVSVLPVRMRKAVVTLRSLKEGQLVSGEDLALREFPEGKVPPGALADLAVCQGRRVLKSLPSGAVLTSAALLFPRVVARGGSCVLSGSNGKVSIRCEGKALADARIGEVIAFEVLDSGKRVRARVRAEGEAELCLGEGA